MKAVAKIRFGDDLSAGGGFRMLGVDYGKAPESFLVWLEGRATLPAGIALEEPQSRVIGLEGGSFVVLDYEPLLEVRHGCLVVTAEVYRGSILQWASAGLTRATLIRELNLLPGTLKGALLGWMLAEPESDPVSLSTGLPFQRALALALSGLPHTLDPRLDIATFADLGAEGRPNLVLRSGPVRGDTCAPRPSESQNAANAILDLLKESPEVLESVLGRAESYLERVREADWVRVLALSALREGVDWWARVPEAWLEGCRPDVGLSAEDIDWIRRAHAETLAIRALEKDPSRLGAELLGLAERARAGVSFSQRLHGLVAAFLSDAASAASTDYREVSLALLQLRSEDGWREGEGQLPDLDWWQRTELLDWGWSSPAEAVEVLIAAKQRSQALPDLAAVCIAGLLREGRLSELPDKCFRFHQGPEPAALLFTVSDHLTVRGLLDESAVWQKRMKRMRKSMSWSDWLDSFPTLSHAKGPGDEQAILLQRIGYLKDAWLCDRQFLERLSAQVAKLPPRLQEEFLAELIRRLLPKGKQAQGLARLLASFAKEELVRDGLVTALGHLRVEEDHEPRKGRGRRVLLLSVALMLALAAATAVVLWPPSWLSSLSWWPQPQQQPRDPLSEDQATVKPTRQQSDSAVPPPDATGSRVKERSANEEHTERVGAGPSEIQESGADGPGAPDKTTVEPLQQGEADPTEAPPQGDASPNVKMTPPDESQRAAEAPEPKPEEDQ